jgi:hypothetical protein
VYCAKKEGVGYEAIARVSDPLSTPVQDSKITQKGATEFAREFAGAYQKYRGDTKPGGRKAARRKSVSARSAAKRKPHVGNVAEL